MEAKFRNWFEHATYTNSTYQRIVIQNQLDTLNFSSELNIIKTSLFGQLSKQFLNEKLILSVGLRTDQNNYSKSMNNPLEQISPRLSISTLSMKRAVLILTRVVIFNYQLTLLWATEITTMN